MVVKKSDVLDADAEQIRRALVLYEEQADTDLTKTGKCIIRLEGEPARFRSVIATALKARYTEAGWSVHIDAGSVPMKNEMWYNVIIS